MYVNTTQIVNGTGRERILTVVHIEKCGNPERP